MLHSSVQRGAAVPFPAFTGERVYMHRFAARDALPASLRRWQPTVDAMLDGIDAKGDVFLMIDQQRVTAGSTSRRPGAHIDGWWDCQGWRGEGDWRKLGVHRQPGHIHHALRDPQAVVLASDVLGAAAYVGALDGEPAAGGDCSHLDLSGLRRVAMTPGFAWRGPSLSFLHESVPVERDCLRTVVRLNVEVL